MFALLQSVWSLLQNSYEITHLTLGILPWEIKNSNFLQIFSRYVRKWKQIAFWVYWWIPVSHDISWTVLRGCGLSYWLKTKSLTVSTFSSGRALRGLPLPGRLSTVPMSCNFFQQLVNTTLSPAFLRKFVCQPLCCVPLQIQTFYQNLVFIAEYHVDCWQTLQWHLFWRIYGATNWSQK